MDRDEGILRGSAALSSAPIAVRPVGAHERADWEGLWKDYLDFYETTLADCGGRDRRAAGFIQSRKAFSWKSDF
jgi:hypothetical protein